MNSGINGIKVGMSVPVSANSIMDKAENKGKKSPKKNTTKSTQQNYGLLRNVGAYYRLV